MPLGQSEAIGQSETQPTTEEVAEQPIHVGAESKINPDKQSGEEKTDDNEFLSLPPEEVREILDRVKQSMIKSRKNKRYRPVNQGKLSEITINPRK